MQLDSFAALVGRSPDHQFFGQQNSKWRIGAAVVFLGGEERWMSAPTVAKGNFERLVRMHNNNNKSLWTIIIQLGLYQIKTPDNLNFTHTHTHGST